MNDGKGKRDKGQGTRDKGQRTKDKGQVFVPCSISAAVHRPH